MKIKLTESQLRKVIKESVIKLLIESNPIKLQNSFKSKEDMTNYRDNYSPNSENNGPFIPYRHTVCDDGYDYCGDDINNEDARDYNNILAKRLATKGGQMSFDWDNSIPSKKQLDYQHREMDNIYNNRQKHEDELSKRRNRISNKQKDKYIKGYDSNTMEDNWKDLKDIYNRH